jgi:hypothetical protein
VWAIKRAVLKRVEEQKKEKRNRISYQNAEISGAVGNAGGAGECKKQLLIDFRNVGELLPRYEVSYNKIYYTLLGSFWFVYILN